jgi:hypothetical protein
LCIFRNLAVAMTILQETCMRASPSGSPSALRSLALLACAAGLWGQALAAPVTTQFDVRGDVVTQKTYGLAALDTLPQVTQTDTFLAGNTPQTHTYSGPSIWNVVNDAGLVLDPSIKNDLLRKVVIATGSDGYRVVYALGEIAPNFGNRPAIVADRETIDATTAPLGADGFARTTAPGDIRGGRYVSNLDDLSVIPSASTLPGVGGGLSTSFSVTGDVLHPGTFDLAALQALPAVQQPAGTDLFTGVSFWSLLNDVVGLRIDPSVKNDVLDMYVVATGSDGYKAAFSLGELDPLFGNEPDLVAYGVNGSDLGTDGFARIVAPDDVKRGRYVSNLIALEVFHAAAPVPEPEIWALLLVGLGALGHCAERRRGRRDPARS